MQKFAREFLMVKQNACFRVVKTWFPCGGHGGSRTSVHGHHFVFSTLTKHSRWHLTTQGVSEDVHNTNRSDSEAFIKRLSIKCLLL